MATFKTTSDQRRLTFTVTSATKVVSYRGTRFTPNHCTATVVDGKVVSLSLSELDGNGWGMDDPAGPDGAELTADFGGGELTGEARTSLPRMAKEALAAVEAVLRPPARA